MTYAASFLSPSRFAYKKLDVDDEGVHGTITWEVSTKDGVVGLVYENWGYENWPFDRRLRRGFEANGVRGDHTTRANAARALWRSVTFPTS